MSVHYVVEKTELADGTFHKINFKKGVSEDIPAEKWNSGLFTVFQYLGCKITKVDGSEKTEISKVVKADKIKVQTQSSSNSFDPTELIKTVVEGVKEVFESRISNLEKTVKAQEEVIATLKKGK